MEHGELIARLPLGGDSRSSRNQVKLHGGLLLLSRQAIALAGLDSIAPKRRGHFLHELRIAEGKLGVVQARGRGASVIRPTPHFFALEPAAWREN